MEKEAYPIMDIASTSWRRVENGDLLAASGNEKAAHP
jgi:hypothetical protein